MAAVGTDVEIMLKDIGMIYKSNTNTDLVALTNVTMNIYKGEFISLLGSLRLRKDYAAQNNRRFAHCPRSARSRSAAKLRERRG